MKAIQRMYCIEHEQMVSVTIPKETSLYVVPYHFNGVGEVDVCDGPFTACPPPTEFPLWEIEPSIEEMEADVA